MKRAFFLIAMLALSLISAEDFSVSPLWKHHSIMGRDFWNVSFVILRTDRKVVETDARTCIARGDLHFPLEKASPAIQALAKNPAFSDVATMYRFHPDGAVISNPDGSCDVLLPDLPKNDELRQRPFFIRLADGSNSPVRVSGMSPYKLESPHYKKTTPEGIANYRRYFFGVWKSDPERFAEWKKRHPDFVSFYGCGEWWNNTGLFGTQFDNALNVEKCLTDEEAEQIRREYFIPEAGQPFTQEMRLARGLKFLDKQAEVLFGSLSDSYVFDGVTCVGHLAAYRGTGMAALETSRIWMLWQNQVIGERGAARQFNIPWLWFVARFNAGRDIDGKFSSKPYCGLQYIVGKDGKEVEDPRDKYAPLAGLSHNLIDRVFYMAYLQGTNFIENESPIELLFSSTATWERSIAGRNYERFYNFTRENPDRGIPYTPIALLRPQLTLSGRAGTNGEDSEMDNALIASIYRLYPDEYMQAKVPGFQYENLTYFTREHDGVKKAGFEMGFANTAPYGDSFDAITPDFADQTSFRRIIPAYKAAILVGKFKPNPEMAEILVDYVRNGGTLVINTRQIDGGYPREFTGVELTGETLDSGDYALDQVKLAGAKVIRADAAGNPLFTRNAFGKGSVIVTTPQMLIPKSDRKWEQFRDDAISGKSKFEHVEALLELLCAEFVPVKVEGDIGFGLNKNSTGWWLYLFNHKGVMKLDGQAEWFDQERTAKVKVDLSRLNIKSVKELRGGENIPLANNTLRMNIGPGDFKILELKK